MSAARYPGLFQNYGVVPAFITPLPTAQVQADLADMWHDGYRQIRLWLYNPLTSPSSAIANIKQIGLMAKAMGFSVMIGCTSLGTTLNDTNWTALSAAIAAEATSAASNGFNEFIIDNEAYGRQSGLTNFFTKYGALATTCKTNFPSPGIISYNESENNISNWTGQTIGSGTFVSLDAFGMNTYGGGTTESGMRFSLLNLNTCWQTFGSKSYISETNIYSANPYTGLTSRQIYELSKSKIDVAFRTGFTRVGWFSWTSPSDQFAIKKADGTFNRNRYALTNARRLATELVL